MATKKPTKEPAYKKISKAKAIRPGSMIPYGPPIMDALRSGDAAEMKKVAAAARKYIKEVEAALAALEKKIGKG
jgi:MinD-like ATPase involved in chromosome partitioning or flagellar assembly